MANFTYAAKDPTGKTVEGTITANDKHEAVDQLRSKDLVVLRCDPGGKGNKVDKQARQAKQAKAKAKAKSRAQSSGGGRKIKGPRVIAGDGFFATKPSATKSEIVIFTRQLATMISAGISLLEALEVLYDQAESPGMKVACGRLVEELRGGSDLSAAMKTCPKAFNPLYVSMVMAGEASGQMDVILERLADYVEASEALKREIKSAMTYPVISLVLVLSITAFLMIGVVPGFKEVFDGLGVELPQLTKTVLAISDWMREYWYWGLAITFFVPFSLVMLSKTDRGGLYKDHVILHLPVFGMLTRKIALARFSRTFSTLVRSGVPIMGTLDIVADTSGNRVVADVVRNSREAVRNGNMLSEPLSESTVFPPMVTRMIAIGEKSGALEQLLEKIAQFYDAQVKAAIKSLTSLIEPLLICFMGGLVGVVIISIFLPILSIIGTLSES
ncbi:MAG: type II secretion system F family protein [Planctomycetota bacterium]